MDLFWEIYLNTDRVLHIASGITWIGLLYYFNFIQTPSFAQMDATTRSNVIQILVPRALLWFRWAAFFTVLFGVGYVVAQPFVTDGYFETGRFYSILVGGTMGIIMASNVWFIIWPMQKKIIAAAKAGTAPEPAWGRAAALASRTNTMLSIPMLFFMVAAIHLPRLWA